MIHLKQLIFLFLHSICAWNFLSPFICERELGFWISREVKPLSHFPFSSELLNEIRRESRCLFEMCYPVWEKNSKKWIFLLLESIFTWNFPSPSIHERELGMWIARELKTLYNFPFPSKILHEFWRESQHLFDKYYPMWDKNSKKLSFHLFTVYFYLEFPIPIHSWERAWHMNRPWTQNSLQFTISLCTFQWFSKREPISLR